MEEQSKEPPQQDSDSSPKLFGKMNGTIAAITGLVVAIGGLATATKGIWGGTGSSDTQAVASQVKSSGDEAAPDAEEDLSEEDPGFYDTDEDGSLRFLDGLWVETARDGTKLRYEEISNDGAMTVAVDRGGGEEGEDVYLRWPNQGGQAQKSWDRQANWSDVFNVYPKEEPA